MSNFRQNVGESSCVASKPLNGFELKLLALVTMTIDHIAAVFGCGSFYPDMRAFGRIAFPIYCFLIVEGYFHTKNVYRYAGRLFLAGLLAEIPFDLAIGWSLPALEYQNVMFTLLLGLIGVTLLDRRGKVLDRFCKTPGLRQTAELVYCGGSILLLMEAGRFLHTDYGAGGVLVVLLFYIMRDFPLGIMVTLTLTLYSFFGSVEMYGLFSLPFIFLYNGKQGAVGHTKAGKTFFYLYYPVHLAIIVLVFIALNGTSYYNFGL